jgi:hypothetical protein
MAFVSMAKLAVGAGGDSEGLGPFAAVRTW